MTYLDKLFEGRYTYKNKGVIYTEENFKIERQTGFQGHFVFSSEVLSRVKTGEFLKLLINYEVTSHFDPVLVSINRQLGKKESSETFDFDLKTKNLTYSFEMDDQIKRYEKIYTAKPHIAVPSFSTSMLMVNQKRMDPVHRNQYTLLGTNNIWSYIDSPTEQQIYIELQKIESVEIKINNIPLKTTHCKMLTPDKDGAFHDDGHSIYLSKHYFLPYQADFGDDIQIKIENLKNYEEKIKKNYP